MDGATLVSMLDFSHARLLSALDAIEKSKEDPCKVLSWRPAPGRAHIAWQLLHCAATHDKYLNVVVQGKPQPTEPELVKGFGGGSTPTDEQVPSLAAIRAALHRHFTNLRAYVAKLDPAQFDVEVGPPDRRRKVGDAIILLAWHEGHHHGQAHLTWNLYKQANGIV